MALLLIEFVRHRHSPSSTRLRVSVDSRTTLSLMASSKLAYTTAIRHFIAARQAPRKPVLTSQLHHAIINSRGLLSMIQLVQVQN